MTAQVLAEYAEVLGQCFDLTLPHAERRPERVGQDDSRGALGARGEFVVNPRGQKKPSRGTDRVPATRCSARSAEIPSAASSMSRAWYEGVPSHEGQPFGEPAMALFARCFCTNG